MGMLVCPLDGSLDDFDRCLEFLDIAMHGRLEYMCMYIYIYVMNMNMNMRSIMFDKPLTSWDETKRKLACDFSGSPYVEWSA